MKSEAFSITEQLAKLPTVDLPTDVNVNETDALSQWEELTKSLSRFGKQQMRTNQVTDMLAEQIADALRALRTSEEDGSKVRVTVLELVDLLDDLAAIAAQRQDTEWSSRVERLTNRTLEVLSKIGISEIKALGAQFDAEVHEAIGAEAAKTGQPQYQVVEVVRRGFRFNGAVLRRAQVVATK